MERKTYDVTFVTPCFLGGASGTAEWRAPSIRGQLRWWFRAVAGGWFQGDVNAVREAETALFGSTEQSSALRIRCSPSPEPVRDLDFAPGKTAAAIASLWGDSSPATVQRLKIIRDGRESFSNPVQYLGFGPIVGGKLVRPCLPPGSSASFTVQWSRPPANDGWRQLFDRALWAWLHLGGIGARSRKGFGSLHHPSTPMKREDFSAQAGAVLALGREMKGTPEWTHFSHKSQIFVSTDQDPTWEEAMCRLGAWLIGFRRRYGYPMDTRTAGSVPLANRDYEWAARGSLMGIPDKSGFGLPLPFGRRETVVWDSPEGDSRRASPLLLHIEKLGDSYASVLTYLPARLLPAGRNLIYRGRKKPTFAPTSQILDVIDRFLDDLHTKKRIEVIP